MKVLIIDDSQLVRERLVAMLSEIPDIDIVGEANDVDEAKKCMLNDVPDIVIFNLWSRRSNGIEYLQTIKKKIPNLILILITDYPLTMHKRYKELGADFIYNKASSYESIFDLLNWFVRSPYKKNSFQSKS